MSKSQVEFCVACGVSERASKKSFMRIASSESEDKIRTGGRFHRNHTIPLETLRNQKIHRKCYLRVTRKLSPIKRRKKTMPTTMARFDNGGEDDIEVVDELEIDETTYIGKV